MIYIIKQAGLYQNKVNSSLISNCNCKMGYLSFVTRAATKTSICKVYALGGDLDGYEGLGGHAHSSRGKSPAIAA